MARKLIDWTKGEDDDRGGRPTRQERRHAGRADADESTDLADRLMALPESAVGHLPLDEETAEYLREVRAMKADSARRRSIRRLAGMLRDTDREALLEVVARLEAGRGAEQVDVKHWEGWRDRLLAEGDAALDALLARYPHADAARLRGLAEQARTERATKRPPHAFRELFRVLRALEG